MTMLALLEQEKEKLLSQLSATISLDKSQKVLENELDRILLIHNENCKEAEKREAASYMLQTARLALPLINALGESKVWENPDSQEDNRKKGLSFFQLLLLAGAGLCIIGELAIAFQFAMSAASVTSVSWTDSLLLLLLAAGVPALTWIAASQKRGQLKKKSRGNSAKETDKTSYLIEHRLDPEKIYRCLHNMLYVIDRNLADLSLPQEGRQSGALSGNLSVDEIDLLADLLEAAGSGDGDYAIERIGDIRYYLHRKEVEIVDYSGNNRELFDFMPAKETSTLRPALISDGKVLKKGLAAEGRR